MRQQEVRRQWLHPPTVLPNSFSPGGWPEAVVSMCDSSVLPRCPSRQQECRDAYELKSRWRKCTHACMQDNVSHAFVVRVSNADEAMQAYMVREALSHATQHLETGSDLLLGLCTWAIGEYGDLLDPSKGFFEGKPLPQSAELC